MKEATGNRTIQAFREAQHNLDVAEPPENAPEALPDRAEVPACSELLLSLLAKAKKRCHFGSYGKSSEEDSDFDFPDGEEENR